MNAVMLVGRILFAFMFVMSGFGLSIILGVYADLGALVLAILLVAMAVKMHDFWNAQGEAKQPEMIGFLKNISMAGGALFLFAYAATTDSDIGPALGKSLWSLAR
jgi:uncharacterized membrane protein YphA (DoxX/SURF4 family)